MNGQGAAAGAGILGPAVCIALFAVGIWSVPLAMFGPDRAMIPGHLGDARFNNYILEHFHRWITGRTASYWDAPFMYPWKNAAALGDNLLGSAPVYSLFRGLGFSRESAFQGWLLALFSLNYWCCLLALRKWAGSTALAACGAYIFAFGMYNIGQVGHAQLLPRFMVPLAFLFLWNHLRSGSWKWLLLAVLAVDFQFCCGISTGFMLACALFFLLAGHLIAYREPSYLRRFRSRRFVRAWLAVMAGGLLLLAPVMGHYMAVPRVPGTHDLGAIAASLPRPASYFATHPAALSWRSLSLGATGTSAAWDGQLNFVGALPWLAVLAVPFLLFSKKTAQAGKRLLACMGAALVLSTLFSLNVGGFSPGQLVFLLPGFPALPAMGRFINVQVLFFLLLLVAVLRPLFQNRRAAWALSLLLPVLAVQDNRWDTGLLERFNKFDAQDRVQEAERRITREYAGGGRFGAIAYEPPRPVVRDIEERRTDVINTELDAMLAGQELGIPVVNAYAGEYPGNYTGFFNHAGHRTLAAWCAFNGMGTGRIQEVHGLGLPVAQMDTVAIRAANGEYLRANTARDGLVVADGPKALEWETYVRIHTSDGRIAFMAHNGGFVQARLEGGGELVADGKDLGDHGLFTAEPQADGTVALRAFDGCYLALDTASREVRAAALEPGAPGRFEVRPVPTE